MIQSIDPKNLSVNDLQTILQNSIAPRPIAFASTIDNDGNPNLSPFSFFNIFSSNPPVLIFSPARKGEQGELKDTYLNVKEIPEVVINMVNFEMVEQMSLASVAYVRGIDEFKKSGFTPLASELVRPFRVKESPVQFECDVQQIIELGSEAGAGNLIICLIKRIHLNSAILDVNGNIDPLKTDLVGRMGGSYYIRTIKKALFQIPKPIASIAMGIDVIPDHIKNSKYLTGNELARLGGLEKMPIANLEKGQIPTKIDFKKAKILIKEGKIIEAFGHLY